MGKKTDLRRGVLKPAAGQRESAPRDAARRLEDVFESEIPSGPALGDLTHEEKRILWGAFPPRPRR